MPSGFWMYGELLSKARQGVCVARRGYGEQDNLWPSAGMQLRIDDFKTFMSL